MNEFATPEWLKSHGAFLNQRELVMNGVICGFGCQLRFGFDPFDGDQISQWCLVPSTGDGRIWLPTSHVAETCSERVSIARFYAVTLVLGIEIKPVN